MSELTQKTLRAIAARKIQPIPLWATVMHNGAYWLGAVFLALFSALATAVSFHSFFEIDWDAYAAADFSWTERLLSGVPFFSIILLIIFLWAGILLLQQTRRGYRYPMTLLVGVFLSTSVAFGYFVEESPLDEPTERFFLRALPHDTLPTSLLPSAARQWSQPERGLLGGTVLSSDATDLRLIDASQKLWTVDYSDATVPSDLDLDSNQDIKVIGEQDGETEFRATEIRDWKKPEGDKRTEDDAVVVEGKKKIEQEKQEEKEKEKEDAEDEEKDEDEDEDEEEVDDKEEDRDEDDDEDEDEADEIEHDEE